MGAKSLAKQARVSLVPTGETARLFDQMREKVTSTRPWARNIVSLRIRFPEESVTLDESLEFASDMGKRRLAAHTIARLALENERIE